MKESSFLNLVLAVILTLAVGWLLYVGQSILLPILTAIILVYVIIAASESLRRLPGLRVLPIPLVRFLALVTTTFLIFGLSAVLAGTVTQISEVAPTYQANLYQVFDRVALGMGLKTEQLWLQLRAMTLARIDFQEVVLTFLGGLTRLGGSIFLVVLYAAFMLGERFKFQARLGTAFRSEATVIKVQKVLHEINLKIREYLAIKTLLNIILGIISYFVLLVCGVEFPAFWAIFIALLNYIPYVGSYIGVAFPVVLSLAQFASIEATLLVLGLLIAAQIFVGNFLEPKLLSRQLNLSPVAVLMALSLWTALWGIPGAVLAIPMTSILVIIFNSFEETRFIAHLLAEREVAAKTSELACDP